MNKVNYLKHIATTQTNSICHDAGIWTKTAFVTMPAFGQNTAFVRHLHSVYLKIYPYCRHSSVTARYPQAGNSAPLAEGRP